MRTFWRVLCSVSVFGVWRSAFGVRRSAFGVRCSVLEIARKLTLTEHADETIFDFLFCHTDVFLRVCDLRE